MTYLPELHYFLDQKDFANQKAILITAKTIGQWCDAYQVRLISPKRGIKNHEREGTLIGTPADRSITVASLLQWVFDNSESPQSFKLFLIDKSVKDESLTRKFDHRDNTRSWCLNLNETSFLELQAAWRKNNLPADLFYPADKAKHLMQRRGLIGWMFGAQSSYFFTPKRWQSLSQEKRAKLLRRSV